MRRFFANSDFFAGDKVVLGKDETRHLRDVLRLSEGDEVAVFDGSGSDYICAVETMSKKGAILSINSKVAAPSPESSLDLTMCIALTKGDKFEFVIQKCVELGVTKLIPLLTDRCDVKLHDKTASKMNRWRKIVIESSKQCGRGILMDIEEPRAFGSLIKESDTDRMILFSERRGARLGDIGTTDAVVAIVGPEGGWSDDELAAASDAGVRTVTLNGRVLRAETASIAVATILQNRLGDLN
jgi:16S rRNA (uracil1498-N3)-methyltransferase